MPAYAGVLSWSGASHPPTDFFYNSKRGARGQAPDGAGYRTLLFADALILALLSGVCFLPIQWLGKPSRAFSMWDVSRPFWASEIFLRVSSLWGTLPLRQPAGIVSLRWMSFCSMPSVTHIFPRLLNFGPVSANLSLLCLDCHLARNASNIGGSTPFGTHAKQHLPSTSLCKAPAIQC